MSESVRARFVPEVHIDEANRLMALAELCESRALLLSGRHAISREDFERISTDFAYLQERYHYFLAHGGPAVAANSVILEKIKALLDNKKTVLADLMEKTAPLSLDEVYRHLKAIEVRVNTLKQMSHENKNAPKLLEIGQGIRMALDIAADDIKRLEKEEARIVKTLCSGLKRKLRLLMDVLPGPVAKALTRIETLHGDIKIRFDSQQSDLDVTDIGKLRSRLAYWKRAAKSLKGGNGKSDEPDIEEDIAMINKLLEDSILMLNIVARAATGRRV